MIDVKKRQRSQTLTISPGMTSYQGEWEILVVEGFAEMLVFMDSAPKLGLFAKRGIYNGTVYNLCGATVQISLNEVLVNLQGHHLLHNLHNTQSNGCMCIHNTLLARCLYFVSRSIKLFHADDYHDNHELGHPLTSVGPIH